MRTDGAVDVIRISEFDRTAISTLLCDADGNLFPSEEPAFDASTAVTNDMLAAAAVPQRFTASELRLTTTGKNFRSTASDLLRNAGAEAMSPQALERWVRIERDRVTEHLGNHLQPDALVTDPLEKLSKRYRLAAVSSSASVRLEACFTATELGGLIPPELRFSAEDSLPTPVSKPDPAIYLHAALALGIDSSQGLAIEDSIPGALSAVRAGFPTVGNIMFVPASERHDRINGLREAGVSAVVSSWDQLVQFLA